MVSVKFEYYYGSQAEQFYFYRIPKLLFSDEAFSEMSIEAKVLYGLMLDRMGLSVKNGWFDDENRVYIIYTVQDIMEELCCGRQKTAKLLDELENSIGLIERKRRGLGKPNIIYVKNFVYKPHEKIYEKPAADNDPQEVLNPNFQKYENQTSGSLKSEPLEVPKSNPINNNINNTDLNDTYMSNIYPTNQSNMCPDMRGWIDRYNKNLEKIRKQIDYDSLCLSRGAELIDEIVNIMAEVMTVDVPYYRIEGRTYPTEFVRTMFSKITYGKLEAFLLEFENRAEKIRNPKAYLISALFNIPSTADTALMNRINYDMKERRNS